MTFLRGGIVPYLKTSMTEAFADRDWKRFRERSSTSAFLGLCLMVLGLLGALASPLVNWAAAFNVKDAVAVREAAPLMMVLVFLTLAHFAGMFIEIIYDARMEVSRPRVYELVGTVAGFGLLLLGIRLKVSLPWLALLSNGPVFLSRVPLVLELLVRHRRLLAVQWNVVPSLLREMIRPSVVCLGISFACLATMMLPNLLIAHLLSLRNVTVYSVCYQLATYPLLPLGALMPVFWPAFTVAWRRGARLFLLRRLVPAVAGTGVILLAFWVFMVALGQWFVRWWTGGQINPSQVLLALLAGGVVLEGCSYWFTTFLWSINDLRMLLLSCGLQCLLTAGLAWPFIRAWQLPGVAAAVMVGSGVGLLLPAGWRSLRRLSSLPEPAEAGLAPVADVEDELDTFRFEGTE
ncbi:MAG: hypothetical protein MUP47_09835 [Phycisphaerae bacterium]|nr:hypothetical protein [Phycisphaerae bacterium]